MKISIITVVKNGLPYLNSAIKSVKKQKKLENLEHIIVCSPSNDGTEEYWTSHRDKFPSNDENTDIFCLMNKVVSITPILPDFSRQNNFKDVAKWIERWD